MTHPPATEARLPGLAGFDTWDDATILATLLAGQQRAIVAVERALPAIAEAARAVAAALKSGGMLYYAGAGASIRMGLQDGSELPATFGVAPERIGYLIAGGREMVIAMRNAAEDDEQAGRADAARCRTGDVVLAIAASGTTPYTCAAAETSRAKGATVVAIANNPGSRLGRAGTIEVLLETGPEVIAGSTRLAAATAQKIALNLISTLAATRMGAVHDGMMVGLVAENAKLRERAAHMVGEIAGCDAGAARAALDQAAGAIKPAVLICRGAQSAADAQALLSAAGGSLRRALARLSQK